MFIADIYRIVTIISLVTISIIWRPYDTLSIVILFICAELWILESISKICIREKGIYLIKTFLTTIAVINLLATFTLSSYCIYQFYILDLLNPILICGLAIQTSYYSWILITNTKDYGLDIEPMEDIEFNYL